MQFWVEMYLKYENELENYEPTEDGPINDKKNTKEIPDYKKNPKDEEVGSIIQTTKKDN